MADKVMRSLVVVGLLVLVACSQDVSELATDPDPVIARVNGEVLRASDLEAVRNRTLGTMEALVTDDDALDARLLTSLAASRVMARKAESRMSDQEIRTLDAQTAAWREEQLVKRYLADVIIPEPVNDDEVTRYYNAHPERFGGGARYTFDSLRGEFSDDIALRDVLIDVLNQARQEGDWAGLAVRHHQQGLPLMYQQNLVDNQHSDKRLLAQLRSMEEGEVSSLMSARGEVSVLRLVQVEILPPRPLMAVRNDIRRTLAPVKLRDAVREAMEDAMADVQVDYVTGPAAK